MKLTDVQNDVLKEICNIGMSQAAKQLSKLLQSAIDISIPKIHLSTLSELAASLGLDADQVFVFVSQNLFSGQLSGSSLLVFNRKNSKLLTHSLIGDMPTMTEEEVRACEQEAMLEIGNVIISCCVASIANALSRKIDLTIPSYGEEKINQLLLDQIHNVGADFDNAIIVSTELKTQAHDISGNLVLIMPKQSIETLMEALERMLGD